MRLEGLASGTLVAGVVPGAEVTVVAVAWHGQSAITLTYRDPSGRVGERLLYRDDEASLEVRGANTGWTFDADGAGFRLAAEARRIRLAYLFDPMLAVHLSLLDPLPHQIQAVYAEMLPRQPLRYLLADDPGAGKTIMSGLLIKELALRGDLARCLIVAPGGLVSQWQDELASKFGLSFAILTRDAVEASYAANPFEDTPLMIARMDQLSRSEELQGALGQSEWDLVVVDEAHRMSAHFDGDEVKETKRFRLGRLLGTITRHLLLLTATPHAGKDEDFALFLSLLDADRFEGRRKTGAGDVSDLMRRMVKEKLLRFDGRPLFPERRAYTVAYPLSTAEAQLYEAVTDYVRDEMNRADRLAGSQRAVVGFALTGLQRRLASSPEAIYQSLARRRARLDKRLEQLDEGSDPALDDRLARLAESIDDGDTEDLSEFDGAEAEEIEERVVDEASAARTRSELTAEIVILGELEEMAHRVRSSGQDAKWLQLIGLLDGQAEMFDASGRRRKLIVFSEHRDTLNYLVARLTAYLGRSEAVVAIHGGVHREDRRRLQEAFRQDPDVVVMVATDAAGEGVNLQRAHLLVNYDLPWNPNRIEQRFGRIHRIGQAEVCHMWNLLAEGTREGDVYRLLLAKLEEQRQALGGQVFDVLGQALSGQALRGLLLDAIRYGELPEVRARMDQVIDASVGRGLAELVAAQALAADVMGVADVEAIRAEMEAAAARRLQPHYVRAFFLAGLERLGGRTVEREAGRFELSFVPAEVRNRTGRAPLLRRYERVTFDKDLITVPDHPLAEFVCPGHPLLEAVTELVLARDGASLTQGALLVDETDPGEAARVLLFLEHTITDARPGDGGASHVVSRRFEFVTLGSDGHPAPAGPAPYLDYRAASPEEAKACSVLLEEAWLTHGVEAAGLDYAIEAIVPAHLGEVRARTLARVDHVAAAVKARLTAEINYWDARAVELAAQAERGRQPRINPERARTRADELTDRLARRLAELDAERGVQALPPLVVGAAVVVPAGLLARLSGDTQQPPTHARQTAEVERRAVDAVLATERQLGREPQEMPYANPGFDIASKDASRHLHFIEVKGRLAGAETVSVTRTEILTGLNAAQRYVLALVEVHPDGSEQVRYLRDPFAGKSDRLHFAETSTTFNWAKLWASAEEPS
ncbi:MAG: helicase-related protein [Acidimicrobiales bacterium]